MITHLRGVLEDKTPASVVVDCAGIGYFLQISLTTFSALPESGNCFLFTHLAIRDDAHVLYGFINKEERELFRLLISVSGVGGNTALAILSSLDPTGVKHAIVNGNAILLKSIKGVGPKTAERIIVDLKDRLGKLELADFALTENSENKVRNEALTALTTLGFAKNVAEKTVDKVLKNNVDLNVEEIVKQALSSF